MTTPKNPSDEEAAEKFPPRLFAVHHQLDHGENFWTAQQLHRIYKWDTPHDTEYLSIKEHESLIATERKASAEREKKYKSALQRIKNNFPNPSVASEIIAELALKGDES